mgnify:FL=1
MIMTWNGISPKIEENVYIAENAAVTGAVTLRAGANVWFGAALRGDVAEIIIGEDSNIQDNVSVHTSEGLPVTLGRGVTVGHNAVLHSCTVGDYSLIGMGAIVLDGAVIGKHCIVGAGALVTGGTVIPDGSMVLGAPAKVRRALREDEIAANRENAQEYLRLAALYRAVEQNA